jgi:hypothetical protein
MSDLTGKFTDLETQLASQQLDLIAGMSAINDTLLLLNEALDLLNNNGATNTKYLLEALSRNDPCRTCGAGTISIPPLSGTANPIDEDKCKRVQAFLHAMTSVFTVLDPVSALGVGFNPQLITDAWNEVINGLGSTDTIPVISFTEAAQLFGDLVNYGAGNLLVGGTLVGYYAALLPSLQDAMYASSTPEEAKAAYTSIVNAADIPEYVKPVLIDAAYAGLVNYFLDPTTEPDLTGYDGSVCTFPIGTCITLELVVSHWSNGSTYNVVNVPFGPFTPTTAITTSSGVVTSDEPAFFNGDLAGWTCEVLTGEVDIAYRAGDLSDTGLLSDTGYFGVTGIPQAMPSGTGSFFIRAEIPTSIRMCFAG